MAFTNICLTNNTNENFGYEVSRKTPKNQTKDLYLCFQTEVGPNDGYIAFDVALTFSTIAKGKSETTGYGSVSREYYERIPESSFTARQIGNRWIWFLPLDIEDSKLDMVNSGSYTYTNRRFDAIKLNVAIDRVMVGDVKLNIRTEKILYICYGPEYTITNALMTAKGLVLKYKVTQDWLRTDDYAHIQRLGTNITINSVKQYLVTNVIGTGKFIGNNKLLVPNTISGITQNSVLGGYIYISPIYDNTGRVEEVWKTKIDNIKVVNATKCNPINVKMEVDDENGAVHFEIEEIKSGYADVENVVIKMEPSKFSIDTKIISTLPTYTYDDKGNIIGSASSSPWRASLYYLPFNKEVTINVQPFGAEDSTNNILTFTVTIKKNLISLTSIEDGNNVDIRYNYLPNWSSKPDANLVKLAGRERQSAYYGEGGSVDGTLSGTIIDKDVNPKIVVQDANDFENMPFHGDCVLRTPDGDRRWVSITDVNITPKQLGMSFWKDISIGLTEVR